METPRIESKVHSGEHFAIHGHWHGRDLLLQEQSEFDFGQEVIKVTEDSSGAPIWPSGSDSRTRTELKTKIHFGRKALEQELGGFEMNLLQDLDDEVIAMKMREVKERGDLERVKQLRKDRWVLADLKAGIVDTEVPKEEVSQSINRLVDLVLEEEVEELIASHEITTLVESMEAEETFEEWDIEPYGPLLEA